MLRKSFYVLCGDAMSFAVDRGGATLIPAWEATTWFSFAFLAAVALWVMVATDSNMFPKSRMHSQMSQRLLKRPPLLRGRGLRQIRLMTATMPRIVASNTFCNVHNAKQKKQDRF